MTKKVKKYIEGYDIYQHSKNWTKPPVEKLMLNKIPEKPWTHILVDFITKLPLV